MKQIPYDMQGQISMTGKKILFLVNVDWFFVSHRLPIALAAMKAGYNVHLACMFTDKAVYLSSLGIELHPLPLTRSGTGIRKELRCFLAISRLIRGLEPDIVHCITIKPVLYGGIASRLSCVRGRVASISGLGYMHVAHGFRTNVLRYFLSFLYKLALRSEQTTVIFQNPEDMRLLIENNIISGSQTIILKGSGVLLDDCPHVPEPDGKPIVTFASRLIRDKGVDEFVQAARLLKEKGVEAEFWLIGDADPDNPATISPETLDLWSGEKVVQILGHRTDIADLFAQSNIICLPSYYGEGLPKVLMEAAACGRAVVTTDHPGCRHAIEPDKTGLLVPVRDATALADAMQTLIENPLVRKAMGKKGRALAEREFVIEKIVDAHMNIYKGLGGTGLTVAIEQHCI